MNFEAIFMFAMFYFMIYCSIFWILIYYDKRKTVRNDPEPKKFPLVSIIIPVFQGNNRKEIKKAVVSALSVKYPKKELILCWNGAVSGGGDRCRPVHADRAARRIDH